MKKICKWVSLSTIWAVHSHNPTDSIHLMIKIPAIRITVPLGHVCWPPGNILVGEKKVIDFHTELTYGLEGNIIVYHEPPKPWKILEVLAT